MNNKAVSLYLHVPLCASRCGYCNFYSSTRVGMAAQYTAALCRTAATAPLQGREAATVYFGGGTPLLLGGGLLDILDALRQRLPFAPNAEITLEANPGGLDATLLRQLREGGFNRISFGMQAAENQTLQLLGRRHTVEDCHKAVTLARAAGFSNVSVDIMLATPGQTQKQAIALAKFAAGLGVEHISAYILKVEPDTPFGRAQLQTRCPDEDAAAELYLTACNELAAAGYLHYEISNFARPGYHSRHNTVYWELGDYLGIGAAAHSLLDGRRFFFPPDMDAFVESSSPWQQTVDDGTGGGIEEAVMLGLRLTAGLELAALGRRYGADTAALVRRAAPLVMQGLAVLENGRLYLTPQGFLVSNAAIAYLLEVL